MTKRQGYTMARRSLLKSAGGVVLGLSAVSHAAASRKRYVIVGMGSRSRMYVDAITKTFVADSELVGVCDSNPGRLQLAVERARAAGTKPRHYSAIDFNRMLDETKPDAVIVTTPDATHDIYVVRALDAGCDAITEKPLTTTPQKAQRIIDACARNRKHLRVLFNYRYSPPRTQIKDLLMNDAIGNVLSVDFQWLLNTLHGADYFRRWHSKKSISGGLMVHKATHHFDLVNTAFKSLYLDHEHHDGYYRDRCVFRPEVDIEDTMNVIVSYGKGTTLSYSLNAFNAWEGYRIAFNGTGQARARNRRAGLRSWSHSSRRSRAQQSPYSVDSSSRPTGGSEALDGHRRPWWRRRDNAPRATGRAGSRQIRARGGRAQRPLFHPGRSRSEPLLSHRAAPSGSPSWCTGSPYPGLPPFQTARAPFPCHAERDYFRQGAAVCKPARERRSGTGGVAN